MSLSRRAPLKCDQSRRGTPGLVKRVLTLVSCLTSGARAVIHCPTDPTTCKMINADTTTCIKPETGACWCSRMAYILATYEPAPTQGIHALDTICNWWSMKQLIGKTGSPPTTPVECTNKCVMMAKMMQTSSSGPWSAWLGPAHSCCSFFSPGSVAFLELEETSSSTELLLRHPSASLRHTDHQQTLMSGWDEAAARGLIAEEIGDAADGRPDWVPRDWQLKPGATAL